MENGDGYGFMSYSGIAFGKSTPESVFDNLTCCRQGWGGGTAEWMLAAVDWVGEIGLVGEEKKCRFRHPEGVLRRIYTFAVRGKALRSRP